MRSATPEERRQRRLHVVALRSAGCSYTAIAAQTGLSRTGVFDICKRMEASGAAALKDAPRRGRRSRLDDRQAALVRASIVAHTPDQLLLPALLWTRGIATQWIEQRTGVRLSVRNTALKLRRWGFAPPKPLAKAHLRDGAAAARWSADVYPALSVRVRAEDAELAWLDVTRLGRMETVESAVPRVLRTTPAVWSLFSTVDNRGQMQWAAFSGRLDAAMFIGLLRRRLHGARRKLVVILDPMAVHRSVQVRHWLAEHEDDIEVVVLPRGRFTPSG